MELTELGLQVLDSEVGILEEEKTLNALLCSLPHEQMFAIDEAIGALLAAYGAKAFVAGLRVGRDPLGWLVKPMTGAL